MKLNNSALQELYDTLANGTISFSPYAESPIDKAFRECDEKLQKDIDIWKCGNEILLSANTDLANNKKKLEKEIEGLHKHMDILSANEREALYAKKQLEEETESAKKEIKELRKSRLEWAKRSVDRRKERDDAREECEKLKASLSYSALQKLQKDLDDAKNQLKYFTNSRDNWRSRAHHAEDEVEALKKGNKDLEKRLMETTETLEKVNADRNDLHRDRDKLFEENRKLKARTDCLRLEVEWYRNHYREQSDKIRELKSRLNSMYGVESIKEPQNNVRKNCYEQGQTDLWNMLIEVGDATTSELCGCFPDVCEVEDLLKWDLEDFLDEYKTWQEKKETERLDHMRDYLARFCQGRLCHGCPLESNEYKCGYGYSFMKFADNDRKIISDEELERYYNKVRQYIKDLLNKVFGIDSDD